MIWYSHFNEDSTPERELLSTWTGETLVAVAGSGERLIALLDAPQIHEVIVVDYNPHALQLAKAKIESLRALSVHEYLELNGFLHASADRRRWLFGRVCTAVGETALSPIPSNENPRPCSLIPDHGLVNLGALEKWLYGIRPSLRLWLGSAFTRWVNEGMPPDLPKGFPVQRFNVFLWFITLPFAYRVTGNKDLAFVGQGAQYRRIALSIQKGIRDRTIGQNPTAHLIFAGHLRGMLPQYLPVSFRTDVLHKVKSRLNEITIRYVHADLTDPSFDAELRWAGGDRPVFSSLSDITSFLAYENCVDIVARATRHPGSIAVLRSFLRHRLRDDEGVDLSHYERTGLFDVRAYGRDLRQKVNTLSLETTHSPSSAIADL